MRAGETDFYRSVLESVLNSITNRGDRNAYCIDGFFYA